MDPEEFEKLKQAEKEHLRSIRDLKKKLRQVEQRGRINQALRDMNPDALMDEHDATLEEVLRRTLEAEARLSIAMEQADLDKPEELLGPDELDEEELRKARAARLVQQLKDEAAGEAADPEAPAEASKGPADQAGEERPPEKTIGRMHRAGRNQSDENTSDRP